MAPVCLAARPVTFRGTPQLLAGGLVPAWRGRLGPMAGWRYLAAQYLVVPKQVAAPRPGPPAQIDSRGAANGTMHGTSGVVHSSQLAQISGTSAPGSLWHPKIVAANMLDFQRRVDHGFEAREPVSPFLTGSLQSAVVLALQAQADPEQA
jgi:hypothetical protein